MNKGINEFNSEKEIKTIDELIEWLEELPETASLELLSGGEWRIWEMSNQVLEGCNFPSLPYFRKKTKEEIEEKIKYHREQIELLQVELRTTL